MVVRSGGAAEPQVPGMVVKGAQGRKASFDVLAGEPSVAAARPGLGRSVALYYYSFTSYQIH
jgi:hypothetical protein